MSQQQSEATSCVVPSVVVVDPQFEAYKPLAASARLGKMTLHFRSSGVEAVKLSRKVRVDAWLIAAELDDMAGHDLVALLQAGSGTNDGVAKVAVVESSAPGSRQSTINADDARSAGADAVLQQPITFHDLERLLGLPAEERAKLVGFAAASRTFVTLPIGIGAAVLAFAVLAMG